MAVKSPDAKKPLILAVVLLALGGTAYWLEFGKKPKEQQAEADGKKIFRIGKGAITRVEFAGASVKPDLAAKPPLAVVLTCESLKDKLCKTDDASKWQMEAPLKTKAEDTTVNSLLKNYANLVSDDSIDLTTETPEKRAQLLKDYGLDAAARANPATRRVSVAIEGAPALAAYFGVKHPIGDKVFTLLETGGVPNETKIFVVPDWQLSVFDQKTSYFRDKVLFGLNEKEVSAFTLATSKKIPGKLDAKRSADEKGWSLRLAVEESEGDNDTIEAVLSGVTHLTAKDVLAENRNDPAAKTALSGAKLVYDLFFTVKGTEKRIRFYEKKKDPKAPTATVYALVDGQDPVYEVDAFNVDKIEKTFAEMRVGKMMNVADRYAVTAIEIKSHGSESFEQKVVKEASGQWKSGSFDTARGKIENILDRLTSKIVIAYSGPEPSGDILKMTFRKTADGKDAPISDLEFWSVKGRLYARNLQSKKRETVELAPEFNTSLPWKTATLLEAPNPGASPK